MRQAHVAVRWDGDEDEAFDVIESCLDVLMDALMGVHGVDNVVLDASFATDARGRHDESRKTAAGSVGNEPQ